MQHLLCRQQHAEVFVFLGPEQGWKELPSALRAGERSAQPLLPSAAQQVAQGTQWEAAPIEPPPPTGTTGSSCSLLEASKAHKAPLQALVGLAEEKTPFTSVCSGLGPALPLPPGTQLGCSWGSATYQSWEASKGKAGRAQLASSPTFCAGGEN